MSADSTAGLAQALDFRDECDALYSALGNAPAEAWAEPTQFKGWTFDDVLGHLYFFDHAAEIAARSRDEVQALFRDMSRAGASGVPLVEYSRRWLDGCAGSDLLERWRGQYQRLAAIYAAFEPGRRLAWAGPDMSARSFMSARQMETWAHGQAIFDALGSDRVEHDRLRNIAVMGVNTFGWTFKVNRLEAPAVQPYVRLISPSGALWEWNEPSTAECVAGSAVEFCRVVTQTRNLGDTNLAVTGAVARQWLERAQCFAGPPEQPPAPGTRFKQSRYNNEW
ncbi:MAG: TIGR03084 family metal-binding protein [Steroidobacteraceae bacterium]